MLITAALPTRLGALRAYVQDGALVGMFFPEHRPRPPSWTLDAVERPATAPDFAAVHGQLEAYLAGRRRCFELTLAWRGTEFQRAVWQALQAVPYGHTVTYGELAAAVGRPRSVRAVGAANGRNPLSIVVPCHRVLGAGGALTGYAGGLERKAALLALERGG